MGQDEEQCENVDRLAKLRKAAGDHIAIGNKLILIARKGEDECKEQRLPRQS